MLSSKSIVAVAVILFFNVITAHADEPVYSVQDVVVADKKEECSVDLKYPQVFVDERPLENINSEIAKFVDAKKCDDEAVSNHYSQGFAYEVRSGDVTSGLVSFYTSYWSDSKTQSSPEHGVKIITADLVNDKILDVGDLVTDTDQLVQYIFDTYKNPEAGADLEIVKGELGYCEPAYDGKVFSLACAQSQTILSKENNFDAEVDAPDFAEIPGEYIKEEFKPYVINATVAAEQK